jgi:prepilin-type N-terminal cleavage/methylation domain-containing protein
MVNYFIFNKETDSGFSLVELAIAVGVSAIIATMGIVVSTEYLNGKGALATEYNVEADTRISNADELLDSVLPVKRGTE